MQKDTRMENLHTQKKQKYHEESTCHLGKSTSLLGKDEHDKDAKTGERDKLNKESIMQKAWS